MRSIYPVDRTYMYYAQLSAPIDVSKTNKRSYDASCMDMHNKYLSLVLKPDFSAAATKAEMGVGKIGSELRSLI